MPCIPVVGTSFVAPVFSAPVNSEKQNFTKTFRVNVPGIFRPANLDELVWILNEAEQENKQVRAYGSLWSVEQINTSKDWMLDTSGLEKKLDYLVVESRGRSILEGSSTRRRNLIHVEAGIKIIDLNRMLEDLDFSMISLGGAQGQSIAGAFSTSTHGTDMELPPLPDLIQAIHLVTNGGREFWIESSSSQLTNDDEELKSILPCSDTTIIRSDDALNSVRVGLGRFGVIYSCVIKVRPKFRLFEWVIEKPWSNIREVLAAQVGELEIGNRKNPARKVESVLTSDPLLRSEIVPGNRGVALGEFTGLDITFNPYNSDDCWIRRRWITTDTNDLNLEATSNPLCSTGVSNAVLLVAARFLEAYASLVAVIPFAGPFVAPGIYARAASLSTLALTHTTGGEALAKSANAVFDSEFGIPIRHIIEGLNQQALSSNFSGASTEGKRGSNWNVLSGVTEAEFDTECYNGTSLEMIFSTEDDSYIKFIDLILERASDFEHIGYVSLRFSRSSESLISMHNFSFPWACSIEITSIHGLDDTNRWLEFLEGRGKMLGGRPHWGQKHDLRASEVQSMYAENLNRWRTQLVQLCGLSRMFSNSFTIRAGLEPAGARIHITSAIRSDGKITHLCNEEEGWAPTTIDDAINNIIFNSVTYFITDDTGNETDIIARRFVTTNPDDDKNNNLWSLPGGVKRDPKFSRPDGAVTELEVNEIQASGSSRSIYSKVIYLNNNVEQWSLPVLDAFYGIREDRLKIFIRLPDGTSNQLFAKQMLTTEPDDTQENNLTFLPDCR